MPIHGHWWNHKKVEEKIWFSRHLTVYRLINNTKKREELFFMEWLQKDSAIGSYAEWSKCWQMKNWVAVAWALLPHYKRLQWWPFWTPLWYEVICEYVTVFLIINNNEWILYECIADRDTLIISNEVKTSTWQEKNMTVVFGRGVTSWWFCALWRHHKCCCLL